MRLLALLITFIVSLSSSAFAEEALENSTDSASKPFIVGEISSKPKKRIRATTPIANFLASQLREFGYTHGEVVIASNVAEMASLIANGEVTLATSTIYSALLLEEQANAEIVGVRWKKGVEGYNSLIFSRHDSGIQNLGDLKGKIIAFEKSDSTSAFFMPTIYLLNQGYKLQKLGSEKSKPDPDKIGYVFIDELLDKSNEVNMSIWVYHKRVDAAAFSNQDWDDPETTPLKAKEQLQIIAKTPVLPRGLMLVTPTITSKEVSAIKDTLFETHNSGSGKEALMQFQKTTKITPISEELNVSISDVRDQVNNAMSLIN